MVAGEGNAGGEIGAGDGLGEGSAGGAFTDEQGVPGELGVLGLEDFEGGDEVEVAFFMGEAADGEEDGDAGGEGGADGGAGGGVRLPGVEGVVEDGDALGGDAEGGELILEGSADGDEVFGLAEAPAVELVVEALVEAGGGVAVVEGEPGEGPVQATEGDEEVGFDVVGLDDVGREGADKLADFGEERWIEASGLGQDVDGEAGAASGVDEAVGAVVGAGEGDDG